MRKMMKYKSSDIKAKMDKELAEELMDYLLDTPLLSEPLSSWISTWSRELNLYDKYDDSLGLYIKFNGTECMIGRD